jgi:hypothetical protein
MQAKDLEGISVELAYEDEDERYIKFVNPQLFFFFHCHVF